MTLKNLFYLPIVAAAGFALVALSNSTATLATSHDEETAYCWDTMSLGERYRNEHGTQFECLVHIGEINDYLDRRLPPVDETYDTRENYIQRLKDDIVNTCKEIRTAAGRGDIQCTIAEHDVRLGYLYKHGTFGDSIDEGQESELLIMLWADIKINEWGNQERYDQDNLPPTAGSYYVYRPTVEPQPPQEDRDPPPRSPDTPPASLPSESSYRNTHQDNQQGWDDNQADQYRYDGDGYYRRKQQGDGSFKCYFNGYDGSLANLGEC